MGNKPHRMKKMKMKALRKFSKMEVLEESSMETKKTHSNMFLLKPINKNTASEMLKFYKKDREHTLLKNKPHHHKRTTPGTVDEDAPLTITGHEVQNKTMKKWNQKGMQKSADLGRKFLSSGWKKAA